MGTGLARWRLGAASPSGTSRDGNPALGPLIVTGRNDDHGLSRRDPRQRLDALSAELGVTLVARRDGVLIASRSRYVADPVGDPSEVAPLGERSTSPAQT